METWTTPIVATTLCFETWTAVDTWTPPITFAMLCFTQMKLWTTPTVASSKGYTRDMDTNCSNDLPQFVAVNRWACYNGLWIWYGSGGGSGDFVVVM
ncbi:Hypothetical predicted protein, partial [Olea europaea subsp. europaea]